MTTIIPEGATATIPKPETASARAHKTLTSPWASLAAAVIAILWTVPTAGLLISSFRPENDIKTTGWWEFFVHPHLTLSNYHAVLNGNGASGSNLSSFLINSIVITLPGVIIPIFLATMAAYGFAWTRFPGRNLLFVMIFALQIVPLQVTLIPLLKLFVHPPLNLMPIAGGDAPAGGLYSLWIAHTMFGLPLAIFLLHNFMREIPAELVESARVDGAGHVQIFTRLILPLMTPAIAAFGILQFLWVWNDLLVAMVFANSDVAPLTKALADLTGERGQDWPLLSAGAFLSMIIPMAVFLSMQRFFVRGLLAGSVKG
jgi:alpha-glucoside transport system permease protein